MKRIRRGDISKDLAENMKDRSGGGRLVWGEFAEARKTKSQKMKEEKSRLREEAHRESTGRKNPERGRGDRNRNRKSRLIFES